MLCCALQVAINLNFDRVHVELDCKSVVHKIKLDHQDLSMAGPWIREIKQMLNSRVDFKVSWVSRLANAAAHKLAKVGVGDELCNIWYGVPPECILNVISDDIASFGS